MQSFQLYYEAFSLNPKDWFSGVKKQLTLKDLQEKNKALAEFTPSYNTMMKFLKDKGYTVTPTKNHLFKFWDGSKHNIHPYIDEYDDPNEPNGWGADRSIELDFNGSPGDKKQFKNDNILSLQEMRTLFSLAHETGHSFQYTKEGTEKYFNSFLHRVIPAALQSNKIVKADVDHIYTIWHELNAWKEGMQFIPPNLHPAYKKYAFARFKTYMDHNPSSYKFDEDLWKLWKELDFVKHEQNAPVIKSKNVRKPLVNRVAKKLFNKV